MGTLYKTDPLLRLIPEEEMPGAFINATDEEQAWRGRLFLMMYSMHGNAPHAWFVALSTDPDHVREMKPFVASIPDSDIVGALRVLGNTQRADANG
jgi:hypothetical protein